MSLSASGGAQNLAITVPGIGAYLAGDLATVAHTWCPSGTVGNNATVQFYPQPVTDSVNIPTSVLGATSDGGHVLGASLSGTSITLNDIGVSIPPTSQFPAAECPETTTGTPPNQVQTMAPLSTNPSLNGSVNLTGVTNATAINQIVTGTAPTTASVTTAAPDRIRHLQHSEHFHDGSHAPLLSAAIDPGRHWPRGLRHLRRQHVGHAAHGAASRRFLARSLHLFRFYRGRQRDPLHRHSHQLEHIGASNREHPAASAIQPQSAGLHAGL